MEKNITSLLKKIDKINVGYRIKIKSKKLTDGSHSLRLDYNHKGTRQRVALGIYIIGDIKNRVKDDNSLSLAKTIRDKKEIEIFEEGYGIKIKAKHKDIDFITFFQRVIKDKNDYNYTMSLKYFKSFIRKDIVPIIEINRASCLKFRDYLLNLDVKAYTAHHYLVAFKYVVNQAVREGHISVNPAKGISIKYDEPKMEFLTANEVNELIKHPCRYPQIKNGFLFSCFTGLRKSDLNMISYSDIRDNYLYFRQEKTSDVVRIKLNRVALRIVEEQRGFMKGDRLFSIPTGGRLSERLKEWISGTSISKDVSFHASRHTFGTLLITKGEDIYTVMKLMGHRNISTTIKYLHLVDSKKDKAIDSLDELFEDE